MLSKKNLKELNLSDEQLKKFREFERSEKILRTALRACKVHPSAIDGIISRSDLSKVTEDSEALRESIRTDFADFIL